MFQRVLPLLLLSVMFYGCMLFLTIAADDIHASRLPQVTASRMQKEEFTYEYRLQGNTDYVLTKTTHHNALPKAMIDSGQIFVVDTVQKNDFTYYYVRRVTVSYRTDRENPDYYAITDGISSSDLVVLTGYETLSEGDEVHIVKDK